MSRAPGRSQVATIGRRAGLALLGLLALTVVFAPMVSPNPPDRSFADRTYAPPMRIHVSDADGFHAPFVYRQRLQDRQLRDYRDESATRVPIDWFARGRLMSVADGPLLLLGADSLGRDVLSRLLYGARMSLGVALLGVGGALLIGAFVGGLAGTIGGRSETLCMWLADFVLVLPASYLVLVLRGVLPLTLSAGAVFWLMATLFAVSAWPHVARGVRAIVGSERALDYADAARASGAGQLRLLRHLLPAARGFLWVEVVLLLPAMLVAEATISVLGLGFPSPTASWGAMLQDAANIGALATAPWLLAPAVALFVVALSVHLIAGAQAETQAILGRPVVDSMARGR